DKMNTLAVLKSKISSDAPAADKNGDVEAANPANEVTEKEAAVVEEAEERPEASLSTEDVAASARAGCVDFVEASDAAKQSVDARKMVASASMSGPTVDSVVQIHGSAGNEAIPMGAVGKRPLQSSHTVGDSSIDSKAEKKELEKEQMALDESRRVLDEQKLQLDIEERIVKERRVTLEAKKKKLEEEETATMKLQAALEAKKNEIEAEKRRLEADEARSFFNGLIVDNNASVPKGVDRLKEELAMAEQDFADVKQEMPAKAEMATTTVIAAAAADTRVETPPENTGQLEDSDEQVQSEDSNDQMEPPSIEATEVVPTNDEEEPSTSAGQETEERAKVEGIEEAAEELEEDVAAKAAEIKAHLQAEEAAGTAKAYLESLEPSTVATTGAADESNEAVDNATAKTEPEKGSSGASSKVAEAKVEDAPSAAVPEGDTGLTTSGKKKKKRKSIAKQDPSAEVSDTKKKKKKTKPPKKKASKASQDRTPIDASHPPADALADEAEPSHPMPCNGKAAEDGISMSAPSSKPGARSSEDDAQSDTPSSPKELSATDSDKTFEASPAETALPCDNTELQMNTMHVEASEGVLCESATEARMDGQAGQAASVHQQRESKSVSVQSLEEAAMTSSSKADVALVSDPAAGCDSTGASPIEDKLEEDVLLQETASTEVEAKSKMATEEKPKEQNTVDENNTASIKDLPHEIVSTAEHTEDAQTINSATLDTAAVPALQVSTEKTETFSSEPDLTQAAVFASKDLSQDMEAVEDQVKSHSAETKEAASADVQDTPSDVKSQEATTDETVIQSTEATSTEEISDVSKDASVDAPATGSSNNNSEVDAAESKSRADTPSDEPVCLPNGKKVDDGALVIKDISKSETDVLVIKDTSKVDEIAEADVLVIKDISVESDPVPMKLWSTADPVGDSPNEGPPTKQAPASAAEPTNEENNEPTVVFKGWGSAGPVSDLARLKSQGSKEVSSDASDVKAEESSPPQEAEANSFFSLGAAPRFSWNPFQSSEGSPTDSGDQETSTKESDSPNSGAEESKPDDGEKDGEGNNREGSNDKERSSPVKSLAGFLGLSNHGPSSVSPERQKEEQWEEKMEKAEHTKIDSSTHSFDSQDSLILKAMAGSTSPKMSDQPPQATAEESLPTEVDVKILPNQDNEAVPAVSPRNDSDSGPTAEDSALEESTANDETPELDEKANLPIEKTRLAEDTTDVREAATELPVATEEAKLEATASSRPSRSFEKQESRRRRSRSFNRPLPREQTKGSEQPPPPRRQRSKVDRDAKRA
ncbi:MAG: hypothetical protein SGILL_005003, partial [Bacillariaceae sp.]